MPIGFQTTTEERKIMRAAVKNKELTDEGFQNILTHVHNNAVERAKRRVQ